MIFGTNFFHFVCMLCLCSKTVACVVRALWLLLAATATAAAAVAAVATLLLASLLENLTDGNSPNNWFNRFIFIHTIHCTALKTFIFNIDCDIVFSVKTHRTRRQRRIEWEQINWEKGRRREIENGSKANRFYEPFVCDILRWTSFKFVILTEHITSHINIDVMTFVMMLMLSLSPSLTASSLMALFDKFWILHAHARTRS